MDRPKSFRAASNGFFGDERVYTRQRLYRHDDADFRAELHPTSRDPDAVRTADLDEDPYAEAGYVGFEEKDAAKEQFRSDIADDRFLQMVQRNRITPTTDETAKTHSAGNSIASYRELEQERKRELRVRDEIVRAMERSERQSSMFTVMYAACVPNEYVAEFLFGIEAGSVCRVLKPMLLIRANHLRYHMEESQLRRVLFDVGCQYEHGKTLELKGHMRQHVPLPPAENSWYTEDIVESEHAHFDERSETTTMRILTFQIETPAASTEDALHHDSTDAAGYRVKVICHMVQQHRDKDALNVLCFRTFHFSRYS